MGINVSSSFVIVSYFTKIASFISGSKISDDFGDGMHEILKCTDEGMYLKWCVHESRVIW